MEEYEKALAAGTIMNWWAAAIEWGKTKCQGSGWLSTQPLIISNEKEMQQDDFVSQHALEKCYWKKSSKKKCAGIVDFKKNEKDSKEMRAHLFSTTHEKAMATNCNDKVLKGSTQELELEKEIGMLNEKGYDSILSSDWFIDVGPMLIKWKNECTECMKEKVLKSQVDVKLVVDKWCQENTEQGVKEDSEVVTACLTEAEEVCRKEEVVFPNLSEVLIQYQQLFSLPSQRSLDYQKCLMIGIQPGEACRKLKHVVTNVLGLTKHCFSKSHLGKRDASVQELKVLLLLDKTLVALFSKSLEFKALRLVIVQEKKEVYNLDEMTHRECLISNLQLLSKNQWFAKGSKFVFEIKEICNWNPIMSQVVETTYPKTMEVVVHCLIPKTVRDLRELIDLTVYSKGPINNYELVSKTFTEQLKRKALYGSNQLKIAKAVAIVFAISNFSKSLVVEIVAPSKREGHNGQLEEKVLAVYEIAINESMPIWIEEFEACCGNEWVTKVMKTLKNYELDISKCSIYQYSLSQLKFEVGQGVQALITCLNLTNEEATMDGCNTIVIWYVQLILVEKDCFKGRRMSCTDIEIGVAVDLGAETIAMLTCGVCMPERREELEVVEFRNS